MRLLSFIILVGTRLIVISITGMGAMKITRARFSTLILIFALGFSLLLAACANRSGGDGSTSSGKTFEVAPVFREFYAALGGEGWMGSAISRSFDYDKFECQYTVNALVCQDPLLSGESRFFLYPLGNALKINATTSQVDPASADLTTDKYTVYEEFIPAFDRLSGERYAGSPITQVRINYAQQRVEQYFQNVGMYRSFSDPPGSVNLLAYGAYSCADLCSYTPKLAAALADPGSTVESQPFLPVMGGAENSTVFGEALTQPYIASDGALEQIYTSIIIFSPPGDTKNISLRPLPALLGIDAAQPAPQQLGNRDGVVFYAIKDNLGFHVPITVDEFIASHGGTRLSGDPISECVETSAGVCRQCFKNYCLIYQSSAAPSQQVTLAPLGSDYLALLQAGGVLNAPLGLTRDTVRIGINQSSERISQKDEQQIEVSLTSRQDESPLAGIDVVVTVRYPGGLVYTGQPAVTGADGTARITIPPANAIPNGSLVIYDVCLQTVTIQPVCEQGSYLIFNTP